VNRRLAGVVFECAAGAAPARRTDDASARGAAVPRPTTDATQPALQRKHN